MSSTPTHSVSVAGIVVDDQDRVLVIRRRDNGHLEPPGGVLELGETPEEGARREVLEETGVEVEVEHLSGVYKNMTLGVIALVFRCRAITGTPHATDETVTATWLDLHEVLEEMTPAYAVRVTDAFDSGAQVRAHDGRQLVGLSESR